jgi:hypothetical protein
MEKRPELRVSADIPVRAWGLDADGKPFFQSATADNLSSEGAQLSHISHSLKIGDIIGIPYGNRPAVAKQARGTEKRRFTRHQVRFPIEISFTDGRRAHMQCSSTDIGGRGCYVETMVPLHIGTEVVITFWIDSEKIKTTGVVRASDPGVGMGIEFTALEEHIQKRLQAYLEKIDQGFTSAAAAPGL